MVWSIVPTSASPSLITRSFDTCLSLHRPWAGTGGDRDSRRLGKWGREGGGGEGAIPNATLSPPGWFCINMGTADWARWNPGLLMFRLILRNKVTRLSTKPHLWETKKSRRRGESNRHRPFSYQLKPHITARPRRLTALTRSLYQDAQRQTDAAFVTDANFTRVTAPPKDVFSTGNLQCKLSSDVRTTPVCNRMR